VVFPDCGSASLPRTRKKNKAEAVTVEENDRKSVTLKAIPMETKR
jgi:hypothetical protein